MNSKSFFWRGRFNTPAAPLCEPENDEAFVEESGIKVFESLHADDDDEDDEVHEIDEIEVEDEDPLYQLDVLDDTIVEEGEDDEETDDDDEETDGDEDEQRNEAEGSKGKSGRKGSTGGTDSAPAAAAASSEAPSSLVGLNQCKEEDAKHVSCLQIEVPPPPSAPFLSAPPPPSSLPQPKLGWTTSSKTNAIRTNSSSQSTTNSTNNGVACVGTIQNGFSSLSYSEDKKLTPQTSAFSHIPIGGASGVLSTAAVAAAAAINLTCISSTSNPLSPLVISPLPIQTPLLTSLATMSLATTPSTPAAPTYQKASGGSNSRPSSRPSSRSSSPLAVGLTGNMWAGLPTNDVPPAPSTKQTQAGFFSQTFQLGVGRGRANRLNLPLTRINAPRHKFTIRRVNEQESPAKRTAAYIDSRIQDPNRQSKVVAAPSWLRKHQDINIGSTCTGKSTYQNSDGSTGAGADNQIGTGSGATHAGQQALQMPDKAKAQDDIVDPFSPPQGSFRQRSGTWSIANSRKNKLKQEKEEEVQSRQRRKSGDDVISASKDKEKEKKKDASPGFMEAFRPRSKSDAARGKKPNIISTVKNVVQQSLVSPSATNRSGRRSGDATPVDVPTKDSHYYTWHGGAGPITTIAKVWDVFRSHRNESSEERQRRKSGGKHEKGQLVRRHSMEPERKRNGSGSSFGHTYLRGEDPNQAAIIFRDCRGLPAAAPFLENVKRSELEEDESQILVKFFKYHTTCDLIPTSAKLVIFDTRLQVKKAFYALVYNGVRAAPLWDSGRQEFVGMLTITDFIRILQSFYSSPNRKMEELEDHRLEMWRTLLNDDVRKLISITPNECLYEAIRSLIHHKIHRLPVIDPLTGNVLYIITHKRILKFLYLYINELPKPSIMHKSLRELNIGTYENIETAKGDTLIIEALNKFVERRISALPIVDDEGKLIDIYAKFDVINLAAEGTYHNLEVTLHDANEYRNEWFEGVLKCTLDETMEMIMGRIVQAEVHRLVVVDKSNKVIGIVSLSDILNELVLKPCHDDPASLKTKTVAEMESVFNGDRSECSASGEELTRNSSATPDMGLKTESEESVEKSWASAEGQAEEQKIQQQKDRPSSSAESIDDSKYNLDVTKISETIGQHEVGPISG